MLWLYSLEMPHSTHATNKEKAKQSAPFFYSPLNTALIETTNRTKHKKKWPRWIWLMCVQLKIRRLRVRPPPGRQHSFVASQKHAYIILTPLNPTFAGLGGSGCAVRLETRRSRVQPSPRSATVFHGDWSWNIFYGHSLPSADSRRAFVSFLRKNVHNTG